MINTPDTINIQDIIAYLRNTMSLDDIAAECGVTRKTLSRCMAGQCITDTSAQKIISGVLSLHSRVAPLRAPDTKQAQIAELIARLAAADVEREQIMRRCNCHGQSDSQWTYPEQIAMLERDIQSQRKIIEDARLERQDVMRRCNMQAENLRVYQERVALLEYENNVHKEALKLAEDIAVAHDQQAVDLCHDHALTIEILKKNTDDLKHQKRMAAQLLKERDATNIERLHLKSECQRMAADSLFLQGLRIGFKYTAVFLVLLLIVAAVCWFGGV